MHLSATPRHDLSQALCPVRCHLVLPAGLWETGACAAGHAVGAPRAGPCGAHGGHTTVTSPSQPACVHSPSPPFTKPVTLRAAHLLGALGPGQSAQGPVGRGGGRGQWPAKAPTPQLEPSCCTTLPALQNPSLGPTKSACSSAATSTRSYSGWYLPGPSAL